MSGAPRPVLLRLLAYARPVAWVLLLGALCSTLYASTRMARTWLVKPLLDDVLPAGSPDARPDLSWPGLGAVLERGVPTIFRSAPDELGSAAARLVPGGERAADDRTAAAEVPAPAPAAAPAVSLAERFWALLLAGFLVVAILPVAHFGADYLTEWALGRVLVDIQQEMAAKLLALPLGVHQDLRRGDAVTRTLNDGLRAHAALRILFADVLEGAIAVVAAVVTLFLISWPLALIVLSLAPLLVGVVVTFGRRIRRTARRRQETTTEVIQRLLQILTGIKVIKAFRAERIESAAFARENRRLFRRAMKVVQNRVLSRSAVEGVSNAAGMVVIGLGAWLALRGAWGLSPGSLAAFVAVMITTQRTTRDLTKAWTQLQDAAPSADRFFELVDRPAERPDPPGAIELDGIRGGLRLEKVGFSYGREPVLRDVSFEVRAGEMIAIVGRTGAGKTTLVDLLLGFYQPDSGRIEIDGVDLRRIARDSLLRRVAVVTQEPFLFEGTIRDNVRYGRPDASEAEVTAALHAAQVDAFADGLPEGLDTPVGDAGTRLSGGQRQRVTIARALLKDPELLIFDEATSALDAETERSVQDAVDRLLAGRTVLVIAHRLSTVRRADRIVVLENGTVGAIGTHDELMAAPGLYRELVGLQLEAAGEA